MQPTERNEDSATQSGRRGDNDDEVISTTSSVSAEHPVDGQETVSTNHKIEKMVAVSIAMLETQDIDTDELKFFHAVLIKSADELARQAGEGNDTRSGDEF